MKKSLYYLVTSLACIVALPALPAILIKKEKWNEFGRKIDKYFDVESKHTENFKKENNQ